MGLDQGAHVNGCYGAQSVPEMTLAWVSAPATLV